MVASSGAGHRRLLVLDAELAGDPRRRAGMVAGDHHDPDPGAVCRGDGRRRLRSRRIGDAHDAGIHQLPFESVTRHLSAGYRSTGTRPPRRAGASRASRSAASADRGPRRVVEGRTPITDPAAGCSGRAPRRGRPYRRFLRPVAVGARAAALPCAELATGHQEGRVDGLAVDRRATVVLVQRGLAGGACPRRAPARSGATGRSSPCAAPPRHARGGLRAGSRQPVTLTSPSGVTTRAIVISPVVSVPVLPEHTTEADPRVSAEESSLTMAF